MKKEVKKIIRKKIFLWKIFFLLIAIGVFADGWTSSQPSHATLYADTITSKTDASSVNIADTQGLFVTGDIKTLGNIKAEIQELKKQRIKTK